MSPEIRLLEPVDRPFLERFLAADPDRTMFLRSNLLAAGLAYDGRTYSAQYMAACEGRDVVAVAAHCWNGNMIVYAPRHLAEIVSALVQVSSRPVAGLVGGWAEITEARSILGLTDAPTNMVSQDILFGLDLADLKMPAVLTQPGTHVVCRLATMTDLDTLTRFRVAYSKETLGAPPSSDLVDRCRKEVAGSIGQDAWLLTDHGRPVACSFFNARLPGSVQIGGVYTPPDLRGRGYGRAVVAGSLATVRSRGVRRSILFTGQDNLPAQAAYQALGYEPIGSYGLILFAERH